MLIDSSTPSATGKYYPIDVLNRIAKKEVVYGELGPSKTGTELCVENCSHKVINLNVRSGILYGDVQALNNPMGELFSSFGQYNSTKVEFRPRGVGHVDEKTKVISDYDIIALDCYMCEDKNDNT